MNKKIETYYKQQKEILKEMKFIINYYLKHEEFQMLCIVQWNKNKITLIINLI